jgi:hypothetical protein
VGIQPTSCHQKECNCGHNGDESGTNGLKAICFGEAEADGTIEDEINDDGHKPRKCDYE